MTGQRRHRQPSASYQIRVRGHLGPTTLRAFAALHVQTQAHDTLPRGVADQSALLGVLAQIEELGLALLQVRRDMWALQLVAFQPVALAAGIRCATDVAGFGLLGHLFKLARASGVSAVVDHAAVPLIDGTRAAARAGHVPGGSRRNLQWVLPHADAGTVGEDDLLLLADAQASGGLLVAGELPGAPVIGELVRRRDSVLIIR